MTWYDVFVRYVIDNNLFTFVSPDTNYFGHNLKMLRKLNHFNQDAFATKLGISVRELYRYENGDVIPSIDKIFSICSLLGVSPDLLIYEWSNNKVNSFRLVSCIDADSYVKLMDKLRNLLFAGSQVFVHAYVFKNFFDGDSKQFRDFVCNKTYEFSSEFCKFARNGFPSTLYDSVLMIFVETGMFKEDIMIVA